MSKTITIDERFNGPPTSGNGGYSCGVLAAYIKGPAKVRLYAPPPLNKPLAITADNLTAQMHDEDKLIAQAESCDFDLDIPLAPTLTDAREASDRYLCKDNHIYDTCFVCGPNRAPNDGLCLYPGPVKDWSLLACTWTPNSSLLDPNGNIHNEYIWSALDCPGYFAAVGENLRITLLGELKGKILTLIPGNQELIVFSWPIGEDGQKSYGGVAVASKLGEVLAYSHTTWIALK